ncbi:hypothetical protein MMC25_007290 [Agyrium rufum]|nr:hypothetical protein [Agyrium rufum]
MQFTLFTLVAALATFAAASPIADASPAGVALRRAINKAYFTEAELANTDAETCCCCIMPYKITNVDFLHRLIAASE